MTKYFTIIFLLAGLIGLVWGLRVQWADGSWLLVAIGFGLFLLVGGINYYRTGRWFTDSSGGH